jgi:Transglycosylase SLT domain
VTVRLSYFVAGALCGVLLGTAVVVSRAAEASDAEVEDAAAAANVDPLDLAGAVNTTGLDAFTYLRAVGELPPLQSAISPTLQGAAPPPVAASAARVSCIIAHESGGNARAVNRSSGASGLGQFLRSTWLTTPQGRAGLSVFDPTANRAAIAYMLSAGRAREFQAVTIYGC